MIVVPSCSDATWDHVNDLVEERKQCLEQSNKNLDTFQTNKLQLGQWLSEKELMMSVLGPLSIDPNMLKMQKQQVQVRRVQEKGPCVETTFAMFCDVMVILYFFLV